MCVGADPFHKLSPRSATPSNFPQFKSLPARHAPAIHAGRVSRKKSSANLRAPGHLALESTRRAAAIWVVPRRWMKNFLAIFLLPFAFVFTQTFFGLFTKVGTEAPFWTGDAFWFFSLGATLWTLWFFGSIWAFGRPAPLRVYVFGHELTHAIWVWMWGGRVSHFEFSADGGYVLTDTHNFWIALAPYFYPLYSIVVILGFGAASFFSDFTRAENTFMFMTPLQWLFLLLGATWAFHLSFTVWMIPKGQTDLTYHGTFFSLVIIYLMNLLLLTVFLIVIARELTFVGYFHDLLRDGRHFVHLIEKWIEQMQQGTAWIRPS
jgi:hypothetical protein